MNFKNNFIKIINTFFETCIDLISIFLIFFSLELWKMQLKLN